MNQNKLINLKDWPEPRNSKADVKIGHGHPYEFETKPFISNSSEVKRDSNMSLEQSVKWAKKFRDKAIAKSTKKPIKRHGKNSNIGPGLKTLIIILKPHCRCI